MTVSSLSDDPNRVDEPRAADEYAAVLSQVAEDRQPIIVRRNGEDFAAVIPLDHLQLLRETLAQKEAEETAVKITWDRIPASFRPPQSWFDDEDDNPFCADESSAK